MSSIDRRPHPRHNASGTQPAVDASSDASTPTQSALSTWLPPAALLVAVLVLGGGVGVAAAARSWLTAHLVPSSTGSPGWFGAATDVAAGTGIVALLLLCVALGVRALRRGPGEAASCLVAAGGTMVAYLASEGLKLLFTQQRPCQLEERLMEAAGCPGLSDYAFPSNHATTAAALAAAVAVMAPRLARVVVVIAAAVAVARVVGGMHYVHDVLAGALLGWVTVICAVALLRRRAAAALAGTAATRFGSSSLRARPEPDRSGAQRHRDGHRGA